jgi:glycosyltransferase involved in cell wall biosynthesis
MGWGDTELAAEIHALSGDPDSGFSYHSAANDGFVRESVLDSRATIYVSTVEGYGLPPVESLWLGTPVIASPNIPSLERYSSNGIHVVDPLHPETLREAVLSFLANSYANRKIEETIDLNLPTWRSFAEGVLQWCKS